MSVFKTKFKEFFEKNKKKIKDSEITICIGNEAMDLDSFISSLVVAFAENVVHVVNMHKEVFESKGELVYICKLFEINMDDLIYFERPIGNYEIGTKKTGSFFRMGKDTYPLREKNLKLFLTDHNQPVPELYDYDVNLIIDHHPLEHTVKKAKIIYIDIDVGSATTLVSRYLATDLSKKNHCVKHPVSRDHEHITLCASIAKLLLVPIIVDTKMLSRRTSMFDKIEFRKLKKNADVKKKELKKLRKTLKKERRNDDKLKTSIILQKDFKQYRENKIVYGMSTVKYKFEDWVDREGKSIKGLDKKKIGIALQLQLDDFRRKLGLDFLLVGCKLKGKRKFMAINFPLMNQFAKQNNFQKIEYKGIRFYSVPVQISRKILAPKIKEYLKKLHV